MIGLNKNLKEMNAIVVRAPMQFSVEKIPLPDAAAGGLLLKVEAVGLCGSDLRTLRNGHPRVTFPWVIGHEICGRGVETGARYQGPWQVGELLAVGPLVYCGHCDFCLDGRFELCEGYRELGQVWPGGMAEYIAIPEEAMRLGNLRSVPSVTDPALAAITEPVSSCIHAQEKANISLGETVVIIGSGPIGCIHTTLARARGADKIILADIVDERLKLAEPFGPDATINASKVDLVSEVRRLLGGKGPEVVITATPSPISQVQAVEMARKGGRILLFGGLPKDQTRPGIDMNMVHYNALQLIGTTIFAPRHQLLSLKLVLSGRIPADRLITRFPLDDFVAGVHLAMEGKLLKAVFIP
jgi:L-iditol 2-dehydrogenase